MDILGHNHIIYNRCVPTINVKRSQNVKKMRWCKIAYSAFHCLVKTSTSFAQDKIKMCLCRHMHLWHYIHLGIKRISFQYIYYVDWNNIVLLELILECWRYLKYGLILNVKFFPSTQWWKIFIRWWDYLTISCLWNFTRSPQLQRNKVF